MNEPYQPPAITKKLGDISRIMADGFHFVNMRALLESMAEKAEAGDADAATIVLQVERFYNLCKYVEGK